VVVLAVVIVLVVAVVAYEGMSVGTTGSGTSTRSPSSEVTTTSGAQSGEEIFIQVVNASTMAPIAGMPVSAGPTPSPNDVTMTLDGPTLAECVHEVPNGAVVEGNGTVVSNGTTTTFASCPLVEYTTDASGQVSIANVTGPFFYVKAGNVNIWNDIVVGVEASVVNMTIPLPSGQITTPWAAQPGGATQLSLPFLWPNTTSVLPCGGLPDGSTIVPQGVYAGQYIAYSYDVLQNGTSVALPEDCDNVSLGSP
jgi:hypothetical protein